jgi:hypothetical protein
MVNLKDLLRVVKYRNIEIIGSMTDDRLKYYSDIDTEEFIKTDMTYNEILNFFRNIFKEAREIPNVFLTDFKAGVYSGKALKWNYQDMMNGYKYFENDLKITFQEALTQESTIKLDLIALIEGEFIEITVNYYFDFSNRGKTYSKLGDKLLFRHILYDRRILDEEGKKYKALKRLYLYYNFTNNTAGIKLLSGLFNSNIGKLNKMVSSLSTISLLINNEKKPVKKDLLSALYKIKKNISPYKTPLLEGLDNLTLKKIDERIKKTIDDLNEIVNNGVDEYIKNLE